MNALSPTNESKLAKLKNFPKAHPHVAMLLAALLCAFFIELFASVSTSPLYPAAYAYNDVSIDPNFFLFAGQLLREGKTPYVDFFDHKGLYVFLLNAAGLSLNIGKFGVFLLQVVFYAATLTLLYEAMRELGYGKRGILTTTCLFFIGSVACYGGNHTGEWLLPWGALIVFFFARAYARNSEKYYLLAVFAGGLQAGFSFNSRPSDAMWGLAVCLAYFIHYLRKQKKDLGLLYAIGLAFLGFALPFAVTIPMSIAGGYTETMIKAVIVQNIVYVSGHEQSFRWFYHLLVGLWLLCGLGMTVYRFRRQKKGDLHFFLLCNLLIGGGVNLLIARYTHYYISAFPVMALEIVSFLALLKGKRFDFAERKPRFVLDGILSGGGLVLGVVILALSYTVGWFDFSTSMEARIESSIRATIPDADLKTLDRVYCLDTNVSVYLNNGIRVSTNTYTFQTWWALDNKDVGPTVLKYLQEKKPTWIIQGDIGANELAYEKEHLGYAVTDYVETHYEIPAAFDFSTPRIKIWKIKA